MRLTEQNDLGRGVVNLDLEKLGVPMRFSDGKLHSVSTRFHLPDNAAQILRPNGESILLRIEPDHLGPARLHLTMRGQMLSARVVVETVQAGAAVEGSLDQLTEQLLRAGISVDHIEVMVDGGEQGNQFFDRNPVWHRARYPGRLNDKTLNLEQVSPSPVIVRQPVEYVNRYGVNLLA